MGRREVSVLSVSKEILRYALALMGTPQGQAAIALAGGPVAALMAKWGTGPLSTVLDMIDTPEITDAQVAEALATKGGRVTEIDLATFYGDPA